MGLHGLFVSAHETFREKVIDYPHKKIEILDQNRSTFHPLLGAGSPIQGPPANLVSTDSGLYRLPILIPALFISVYGDLGKLVLGARIFVDLATFWETIEYITGMCHVGIQVSYMAGKLLKMRIFG